MSQFTQAAANTMSRDNPGFGSFMNNMMNSRPDPPMGAPQGPSDSHKNNPPMPPMGRPRFPDVGMTRGSPNFNDAVNMDHRQADPFKTDRDRQNRRKRPEMQGPKDLDDILANLKTKKINLQNRDDNKSVSSIGEIKELDTGKPPKTKRKSHSRSSRASGGVTMSLNGLV